MNKHIILEIAGIGLAAILCQWVAWRVRLPAILFLLLAGIVAGPVAGWLDPDRLFGELLLPFVSLSVAVVLFEGSLTLQFHQIRGLERVVRNMVSVGVLADHHARSALGSRAVLGVFLSVRRGHAGDRPHGDRAVAANRASGPIRRISCAGRGSSSIRSARCWQSWYSSLSPPWAARWDIPC